MPEWSLFAGVSVFAAVALLALARASAGALAGEEPALSFGTGALLVNVALTHGVLGVVLLAVAWFAEIPPTAVGAEVDPPWALAVGVALGIGLYVANELIAALARWIGVAYDERLRELLAPTTRWEWAVLLVCVLPVIAGVEELLFRGALVGALSVGFGLPVWGLAVASSVLFGLGHGLQGPGGVLVTGTLGFALAVAFVLTGSLLVVVVAHYVVNVLEVVVHEHVV